MKAIAILTGTLCQLGLWDIDSAFAQQEWNTCSRAHTHMHPDHILGHNTL